MKKALDKTWYCSIITQYLEHTSCKPNFLQTFGPGAIFLLPHPPPICGGGGGRERLRKFQISRV